ncbi:taste receptor type 2 member 4-like [Dendropsophus ebraccatus]|uniref:taste receptor type 2 member 4-like n=1 Tax=Dendropsophus ebraccatus TaxID=150705 RepID=UPI0038311B95
MEGMKSMYNTSNDTNPNNDGPPSSSSSSSLTIWQALSLGILVLEMIVGTFMNGLMVTVNLFSLVTHRTLGSCDSILTCLGLSRFTFMWVVALMYFVSYLVPNTDMVTNLQYAWLFFNSLSLWLATWLSTFYCVRIVNIRRYIFTVFKAHFDRLLPFFILACIAVSSVCCNSAAFTSINQTFNMSRFDNHKNSTPFAAFGTNFAVFMSLSLASSMPPFFLFCISAGLVVASLLKHMNKMKDQERTGFREPSLDAHYRAVKMMVAFFMFFSLYLIAFILYGSGNLGTGAAGCIAAFFIGAYPSVHSGLLVIGNPKLKRTLLVILQKLHCYQKEVIQSISD